MESVDAAFTREQFASGKVGGGRGGGVGEVDQIFSRIQLDKSKIVFVP